MRIDHLMQIQQLYNNQATQNTKKTGTAGKSFKDQVQISALGKDIQVAKQAIAEVSDVREELVTPLKESMEKGTYNVSDEDFVDKLLSKIVF